MHLVQGGVELGECTLFTFDSAAAIADSIAACAAARPDAPWVRGSAGSCPRSRAPIPRRTLLDGSCPTGPRLFDAADGHSAWANSRALALAGITARHARSAGRPHRARSPAPASRAARCGRARCARSSGLLPERTDAELAGGLAAGTGSGERAAASPPRWRRWHLESHLRAYRGRGPRGSVLTLRVVAAAGRASRTPTGIDGLVTAAERAAHASTPRPGPAHRRRSSTRTA